MDPAKNAGPSSAPPFVPAGEMLRGGLPGLAELRIANPAQTFCMSAAGDMMEGAGIFDGDLLVIDRAILPRHGDVIVVILDGAMSVRILDLHHRQLVPANALYEPIPITEGMGISIEGVVVSTIHPLR